MNTATAQVPGVAFKTTPARSLVEPYAGRLVMTMLGATAETHRTHVATKSGIRKNLMLRADTNIRMWKNTRGCQSRNSSRRYL